MHARADYNADKAENTFRRIREFMQTLVAAGISETG